MTVSDFGRELSSFLIRTMYLVEPETRRRSGWVMNGEWMDECTKLAIEYGGEILLPGKPQTMFGLPILAVRNNGGVPHLEPID